MESLKQKLQTKLHEALDSEATLSFGVTEKNNGVLLESVNIRPFGCNIAPNIYLTGIHKQIEAGDLSVDSAVCKIVEMYHHSQKTQSLDASFINDWEQAKAKLFIALCSAKRNARLLSCCPGRQYVGDMYMYCKIHISLEDETGTVNVSNEILDKWHISEEELFEQAVRNTGDLFHVRCGDFNSFILSLMAGENYFPERDNIDAAIEAAIRSQTYNMTPPVIIVSNDLVLYGASSIVWSDVLKRIAARFEENLYVLPSSTDEVITIPVNALDAAHLQDMIDMVNSDVVEAECPEKFLSDELYLYDYLTDKLSVVTL